MHISGTSRKQSKSSRRLLSVALLILVASSPASAGTIYVDASCGDDGNSGASAACGSASGPKLTIQAGIDAASDTDEVVVAPGTYNEVIDFLGKAITLRSSAGADVTIIDGTGLNDSVVKCITGEGADTVIEGFTITGGTGSACPSTIIPRCGGGMHCVESEPTIVSCVFRDNHVTGGGGGADVYSGDPRFTDCVFEQNSAEGNGGGTRSSVGSPVFERCRFSQNTAGYNGGGPRILMTALGGSWTAYSRRTRQLKLTGAHYLLVVKSLSQTPSLRLTRQDCTEGRSEYPAAMASPHLLAA